MEWITVFLTLFHFQPADKAVNIAYKKHSKADKDRNVGAVCHCSESPENYEDNIVCSIKKREKCTSSECEINCGKTGRDGNSTGNEICSIEISENVVENDGDEAGQQGHESYLKYAEMIDPDLCVSILKWVSEPCDKRE